MNFLKEKSFWYMICGINVTSILISFVCSSPEGIAYAGIGLLSAVYMICFGIDHTKQGVNLIKFRYNVDTSVYYLAEWWNWYTHET